jgi:hypothetical protein
MQILWIELAAFFDFNAWLTIFLIIQITINDVLWFQSCLIDFFRCRSVLNLSFDVVHKHSDWTQFSAIRDKTRKFLN